jgi:excinuclease ABC subunit A
MTSIHLRGVKQNNLKNINVDIPLGSLCVVCGPSGSGKSSLAFETLYSEGQRRYIESLSNYTKQFVGKAPKPDLESAENLPPALALEQKNAVKTSRSTVGTTTEVLDHLRLLFEKLGQAYCPTYGHALRAQSAAQVFDEMVEKHENKRFYVLAPILEKDRPLKGKKLLAALLKEGYYRIYVPPKAKKSSAPEPMGFPPCRPAKKIAGGKQIDISPSTPAKSIPDTDFYVVVDRIVLEREERGRVIDSLSQAYQVSLTHNPSLTGARLSLLSTDGEHFPFSEDHGCNQCGFGLPRITTQFLSFNSPVGACPTCSGFGNTLVVDPQKVIPNPNLCLLEGAIQPFTMPSARSDRKHLKAFCAQHNIPMDKPWNKLTQRQRDLVWQGDEKFFGVAGLFEYLETKKYKMHVRVFLSRYKSPMDCPDCKGTRLKPEVSMVKFKGRTLAELCKYSLRDLKDLLGTWELTEYEKKLGKEVFEQLYSRLDFLCRVGVQYLTLDRPTRTLSGGEYQRLLLAKQLGMGLSQTLFVLDEPTVGLHPRDNFRLISILRDLCSLGNTLVVVEHDRDVIENSTYVLEMGPGSGAKGGELIFSGTRQEFEHSGSPTAVCVFKEMDRIPYNAQGAKAFLNHPHLTLKNATGNNLKDVTISIPLKSLVTITGVSGSGKSSLITNTLYPALAQQLRIPAPAPLPFKKLIGAEHLRNLVLVDQGPVGKNARSSPATYMKLFDGIRDIFASTREAEARGYTSGTFSLNVEGGRCPACKGLGFEEIDMVFMDNVEVPCEVCDGKRYRDEILEVKFQGKNINDVLSLTVDEAMDFFVSFPKLRKTLSVLKSVGLGYLPLGQSSSSLSGGESQRLKIAKELINATSAPTLYIMDEPTTGLHFQEVQLLLKVLRQLIQAGHSVVLIEHNLEVISQSDYVIDIGPEAGDEGGTVVAEGPPFSLITVPESRTGEFLKKMVHQTPPRRESELKL